MSRVLEPGPLLAAALIGGVVLWALASRNWQSFATGAGVGLAVQIGVRVLGVS